ncbi:MAG TPA: 4-(cytidine 5'-diphospho)-2-C-methyl-D-erythritol kinase [Gammaproteobacteria bacterium]|nr:4-(cytidine 5'-diphospho)-2-C-methyl-D-erythritol kinase [Gammaproteobacteria bacterium]
MIQWFSAPAKINLFLHILGQREDGYHILQTAFQFLTLEDRIGLHLLDNGIRRTGDNKEIPEMDDLAVRAALLLQQQGSIARGVEIHIDKSIPIGAGLGGGSSDAATVLLALNQLWELHWSLDKLAHLGLKLGADVPVFIHGRAAWAEGVGEQLTPIAPNTGWLLVIVPNVHIATAEVFGKSTLTSKPMPIKIHGLQSSFGRNDLQAMVIAHYPQAAGVRTWLSAFGNARMSGSGGAFYVPVNNQQEGQRIRQQCPAAWSGFVVQTCNRHPLWKKLQAGYRYADGA